MITVFLFDEIFLLLLCVHDFENVGFEEKLQRIHLGNIFGLYW